MCVRARARARVCLGCAWGSRTSPEKVVRDALRLAKDHGDDDERIDAHDAQGRLIHRLGHPLSPLRQAEDQQTHLFDLSGAG